MAPPSTRKLIALQGASMDEIRVISRQISGDGGLALSRASIQMRKDNIKEIWDNIRSTHAEISSREDDEASQYRGNQIFQGFHDDYLNTSDKLIELLNNFPVSTTASTSSNVSVTHDSASIDGRPAKLPRLDLPSFSGKFEDWENFYDLFCSMVHNTSNLSDATKLQYLKSCLSGPALDLVKMVTTTDANYGTTWQALKTRYSNHILTINTHLTALMNLPFLKKESADGLRGLIDESQRIVRALANMKLPVEYWCIWLNYLIAERLDPDTRKLWEVHLSTLYRQAVQAASNSSTELNVVNCIPPFDQFVDFLENRAQALSMIAAGSRTNSQSQERYSLRSKKGVHAGLAQQDVSSTRKCPLCFSAHYLGACPKYLAKKPVERKSEARRLKVCFNCLGNHTYRKCESKRTCSTCHQKHHSSLHTTFGNMSREEKSVELKKSDAMVSEELQAKSSTGDSVEDSVKVLTACISRKKRIVLLATAQIIVVGASGIRIKARALLDQGSEASFISASLSDALHLSKARVNVPLFGIGASNNGVVKHVTQFYIESCANTDFRLNTEAFVLRKLTSLLPSGAPTEIDIEELSGLKLADPWFFEPSSVDVILGADVYCQIVQSGLRKLRVPYLIAQDTSLGWVISGTVNIDSAGRAGIQQSRTFANAPVSIMHCLTNDDLQKSLQQFWELEELPNLMRPLSPDEETCEQWFLNSHTRDSSGRFVVRLPFKSEPPFASIDTKQVALRSLNYLHRRFLRDPKLAHDYCVFMESYKNLGHMQRVSKSEVDNPRAWYLPHHAVVQTIPNWKLRVVFDASRRNANQHCLNEFLLVGQALQNDLSLILLQWRKYKFVFTTDIVKMFRQISLHPLDQDYHRILWSTNLTEVPVEYRLTTVTYGTACAPYLAIRVLKHLAESSRSKYPLGARCLIHNTYVDDIFAGAMTLTDAKEKMDELIVLLQSAGMQLDKWSANHPDLLSKLPEQEECVDKVIDYDSSVKTLGVYWNPIADAFSFVLRNEFSETELTTKRTILSQISRLFDPLGWLSPCIVTVKILLQDLWIQKLDWDSPLSPEICNRWNGYQKSLTEVNKISIERWMGALSFDGAQIHGFSDASSRAYAAAVYLRVPIGQGEFKVTLLMAKTKVSPVKTMSIPNLELCGATLMVKLITYLQKLNWLKNLPIHAWTDSEIVLAWLRKHPSQWKTFVANRVSQIHSQLPAAVWSHVPSKQNPADLASRGISFAELKVSDIWWHGPSWLSLGSLEWPDQSRSVHIHLLQKPTEIDVGLLTRFSSLTRLIRVVSYCLRPLRNRRKHKQAAEPSLSFLTSEEIEYAQKSVLRLAQRIDFSAELEILNRKGSLPKTHPLCKLNPFVDESDGLLRVGGRLTHSSLSHEARHPPILSKKSHLSRLCVAQAHRMCLHGGHNLTLSVLQRRVWIVGSSNLVKKEIRTCTLCQRLKPRLVSQLMGDLPVDRVTPSRPFSVTGLDYAGPFRLRFCKGRGQKSYKGYIALFVCFSTRAIHLELVSDLTTAAFLSAYRRFIGRRGHCRKIYSDNGTTFQGAARELREMFSAASSFYKEVAASFASEGTTWSFIPPYTPHCGGLWEAGVKSTKHHLRRSIGDCLLTYEEFSTLLVEIEACLNSRPLYPMRGEPEDLEILTPAHFLIGEASTFVPDAEPPSVPENRLSRYQLLQRIRNSLWKRWSAEYLHHLQERSKWRSPAENFAIGQLALIRDPQSPPTKWLRGRVIQVHPGPDGLVRVVTLKTATSEIRRHIKHLSPLSLPTENN
ncbi:uncharacterized protein [Prorops nasuta]|uniref:uncharacterized protein n=1 Tax=Prorops nasuta TaxID=863751 RepID=UPI0034CE0933